MRFENYELLLGPDGKPVELGRGSMGVTYKARDIDLHCDVALKVISPGIIGNSEVRERFLREARAAAQLRHPNIAAIFRLGATQDGAHYYAMEFCDGLTIQQALVEWGAFSANVALYLAWQVSKALRVAEEHRIIHRDLKPANLIITQPPDEGLVIKVIDFGLAKSLADGRQTFATKGVGFAGTVSFASPEQIEEGDLDIRSDFYSLGSCLWFMLTGKPVFEGSLSRVMSQTLSAEPPWGKLAGEPAVLVVLLRRMLAKNRDERPATAAVLRMEMEKCLSAIESQVAGEEPAPALAPAGAAARLLPAEDLTPDPVRAPASPAPSPELFPHSPPARAPGISLGWAIALVLVTAGLCFAYYSVSGKTRSMESNPATKNGPADSSENSQREATPKRAELSAENAKGASSGSPASTSNEKPTPLAISTPAPTPSPPKAGRILVNSIPPRATVLLDGQDSGSTPNRLDDVPEGIRRLRVQLDGYEPAELIVEVHGGVTSDPGTINLIPRRADSPQNSLPQKFQIFMAATPRPVNGLHDETIRALVRNELSATARNDVGGIVACYSSPVDYYDEGHKTSGLLRRDLELYRQMWPLIEIGGLSNINVSPTSDPETSTATYSYTFSARNLQNGRQSIGVVHEQITVGAIGGRPVITRCRQSVTDRKKNY